MAKNIRITAAALALLHIMVVASAAIVSTEAAAADGGILCNMSEEDLKTCKPAISMWNPVDKPKDACCTALRQANLTCLCSYKDSSLLPYLGIDPKLAVKLPAKCGVAPPGQC